MTIQSMQQISGRESSYGNFTEHTATIEWQAISDSRYEQDYTIVQYGINSGILPRPYVTTIFGVDPLVPLLCRSLSIKQDKAAPVKYNVTASYSSAPLSQSEKAEQVSANPLNRPSTHKWKTNKYNKAVHKDIDGKAVMNSAGEYFDPPPENELFRWTCTVTTNVEFIPAYILEFAEGGPINTDSFTIQGIGVSERCARVVDMDIGEQQTVTVGENEVNYFAFSYSLEFRRENWKLRLIDQGTREVSTDDNRYRVPIKDDGTPPKDVKKPWPLNGLGFKLADPTPDNAVELEFSTIQEAAFGGLPGLNT